jgi:hypothetical protein
VVGEYILDFQTTPTTSAEGDNILLQLSRNGAKPALQHEHLRIYERPLVQVLKVCGVRDYCPWRDVSAAECGGGLWNDVRELTRDAPREAEEFFDDSALRKGE